MKGSISVAALALACLAITGCGDGTGGPVQAQRKPSVVASHGSAADSDSASQSGSTWAEQKLIRHASLELEVQSVDDAIDEVRGIARQNSALLADSRITSSDDGHRSASVTVRVPSEHFAATIDSLKGLGKVKSERAEIEDVTRAYLDLETRLEVKQGTAQRLRTLLQTGTGNLPDVLTVERELERVVTEIEQMKGERRFVDRQIALSTIILELTEPGGRSEPSPWTTIGDAFGSSVRVLALSVSVLVYVGTFLGPWLIVAAVVWFLIGIVQRYIRKRKRAV